MASRPRVVLLGDSIRQAWEPRVRDLLADLADVEGPAENGGDTRNLLAHLDAWAIDRDPALVHVNAGLHDIKRPRGGGAPAVSLAEYEQNVHALLVRLQRETRAILVWATTTPVDDALHAARKGFDRHEADVRAYNAVARRVCAALGVPVHDLHAVIAAGGPALLWQDGVHLSEEGYRVAAASVVSELRRRLR